MIEITLDTSCLDPDYPELEELSFLKTKGKIRLYTEIASEVEIEKWENEVKRKKMLLWMELNTESYNPARCVPKGKTYWDMVAWSEKEDLEVWRKIAKIHSPEFKIFHNLGKKSYNKQVDWKICKYHKLCKRDYFVTKDITGFIGKNGEKAKRFKDELGINIRFLNSKFINELKQIIGE
ncbi:MAG TPA: hypothetical protein VMY59_01275 [Candidatus Thermoplasmatota archaeon]|nr:hypothetical protein [Candidatus Thermoplasmatota archaeon]